MKKGLTHKLLTEHSLRVVQLKKLRPKQVEAGFTGMQTCVPLHRSPRSEGLTLGLMS